MPLLRGRQAVEAYMIATNGGDTLSDLSEQDKDEFEFDTTPVRLRAVDLRMDKIMVRAGMASSNSDARRMLKAGAVDADGFPVSDAASTLLLPADNPSFVLRVGRKMKRICFSEVDEVSSVKGTE